MKKSIVLIFATAYFAVSCHQTSTENKVVPTDSTKIVTNQFGIKFESVAATPIVDVVEQVKTGKQFTGVMEGKIVEVCQKAGCWANLELPDGQKLKVKFRDANGDEFGIDINSIGKIITAHGIAYMDTVSVAMQKHYAEDNKETKDAIAAIKAPKITTVFKADGAILK